MAWDTAACLKSLCSAYNNFQQQPCDQSSQDLQRQIDVTCFYVLFCSDNLSSLKRKPGFKLLEVLFRKFLCLRIGKWQCCLGFYRSQNKHNAGFILWTYFKPDTIRLECWGRSNLFYLYILEWKSSILDVCQVSEYDSDKLCIDCTV